MTKGVDSTPLGQTDSGADRDTRTRLCSKNAWCVLVEGHEPYATPPHKPCDVVDGCVVLPRSSYTPPDFGPRRAGKP